MTAPKETLQELQAEAKALRESMAGALLVKSRAEGLYQITLKMAALVEKLEDDKKRLEKSIEDEYEASPLRHTNTSIQNVGHNQGFNLALAWVYREVTGRPIDTTRREAFLKSGKRTAARPGKQESVTN